MEEGRELVVGGSPLSAWGSLTVGATGTTIITTSESGSSSFTIAVK
jgi:hypothetical protein